MPPKSSKKETPKSREEARKAATTRKLVIIFALLGLLHTQHLGEESTDVSDDFKAVVNLLESDKSTYHFSKLLVSDLQAHKIYDDGPHFLTEAERTHVRRTIFPDGVIDAGVTKADAAPTTKQGATLPGKLLQHIEPMLLHTFTVPTFSEPLSSCGIDMARPSVSRTERHRAVSHRRSSSDDM